MAMQPEKEQKNKMTFHGKPMQVQLTECTVMRLQSQAIVFLPFTLRLLVAFQLAMLSGEGSMGRHVASAPLTSWYSRFTPWRRHTRDPLGPCNSGIIQLGTRTVAWCFILRYNINVFVRWPACVEKMDVVIWWRLCDKKKRQWHRNFFLRQRNRVVQGLGASLTKLWSLRCEDWSRGPRTGNSAFNHTPRKFDSLRNKVCYLNSEM